MTSGTIVQRWTGVSSLSTVGAQVLECMGDERMMRFTGDDGVHDVSY
jgi:hypothetical protein